MKLSAKNGIAMLLMLTLTAGFWHATPAAALPSAEVEILYLDDAGNVVGSYFRGCFGERFREGRTTDKTITYVESCTASSFDLSCTNAGFEAACILTPFWQPCRVHYGIPQCSSN